MNIHWLKPHMMSFCAVLHPLAHFNRKIDEQELKRKEMEDFNVKYERMKEREKEAKILQEQIMRSRIIEQEAEEQRFKCNERIMQQRWLEEGGAPADWLENDIQEAWNGKQQDENANMNDDYDYDQDEEDDDEEEEEEDEEENLIMEFDEDEEGGNIIVEQESE
ncbi:MAG: hypothetical protein EZS28_011690 [Streblomastix strix]|uniref:Uncharacterized protein n=1 Tax=Streblomastix strix TaxID=222440 RepID=A0A5J4WER0_9EUKA|nr:MAG: hypothetical protein EZS28_011690 [Streblomastix strix]